MFDAERFVDDCRSALGEKDSHKAIRELLTRAVSEPGDVLATLGEPSEAGFLKLYNGDDLTILNVVWAPMMTLMPHNHNMWAVIGVYTGREDNIFWRRNTGSIEAYGADALFVHHGLVWGGGIRRLNGWNLYAQFHTDAARNVIGATHFHG